MIVVQIVVSIMLIGLVLLQRESGSLAFGRFATFYGAKRGAERALFLTTIFFGVLFMLIAIGNIVLSF